MTSVIGNLGVGMTSKLIDIHLIECILEASFVQNVLEVVTTWAFCGH